MVVTDSFKKNSFFRITVSTESEPEKNFYIQVKLKMVPLKNLNHRDEAVVCEIMIGDCRSFWSQNGKDFVLISVYVHICIHYLVIFTIFFPKRKSLLVI